MKYDYSTHIAFKNLSVHKNQNINTIKISMHMDFQFLAFTWYFVQYLAKLNKTHNNMVLNRYKYLFDLEINYLIFLRLWVW